MSNVKLVSETVTIQFDLSSLVDIGVTISAAVVTADVFSGEDASPSLIISGVASVSGLIVSQDVTAGVAGVIYTLNCATTFSDGQELIKQELLAITSDNPF